MGWIEILLLVLAWYLAIRIDQLDDEITKLKSKVSDVVHQVPIESLYDVTLSERLRLLENQVDHQIGRKEDYFHKRGILDRLHNLEERLEAGARWLRLTTTSEESESELDDVKYCIRGASYQMLKKPD